MPPTAKAKPKASPRYTMTISRLTVDKLGVKLYDKVSAAIAELVANSYDADAKLVKIHAPMGELLAQTKGGTLKDKGFTIVVSDDGIGMTPDEINAMYLKVGRERRNDPKGGDTSRELGRKVMGRKGVGKLAPFGICDHIEVLSSGGDVVKGLNEDGEPAEGYLTAHLHLERDKILKDTDEDYHPKVGDLDGRVRPKSGTKLVLTSFAKRWVPSMGDFQRQLAQRFGLTSENWKVNLYDNTKTKDDEGYKAEVGAFTIDKMPGTEITLGSQKKGGKVEYFARKEDGSELPDLGGGFTSDHDGEPKFYPVTGWAAYSKVPFRDDLMAGIRIYCRGKIASQTSAFNLKAGFQGEYDVRSYLIGELHADWLDEEDDLIQTDRRDILWSSELGEQFQTWGQKLVKQVGRMSRDPIKKKAWELFRDASDIEKKIKKAFPAAEQASLRDRALQLAKLMSQTTRVESFEDKEHVKSIVQLTLNFAPHVELDEKLRAVADSEETTIGFISGLLKTARVAELSSFGLIAEHRVRVIERLEAIKDDPDSVEADLQKLITEAPWLIDAQWSPITANQSFETLKKEFQKYYKKETGKDLVLNPFSLPDKRADFVMGNHEGTIELVEIKTPEHKLTDAEMERIENYVGMLEAFLDDPANQKFKDLFPRFHVTLVCEGIALKSVWKRAFEGMKSANKLTHIGWSAFLLKTKKMHEGFLKEAERQKRDAAKD